MAEQLIVILTKGYFVFFSFLFFIRGIFFSFSFFFTRRYGGGPPRFGGGGGGNRGGPPPGKFGNPGERLRKKHWNLDELPKFQKNFYQEHPDVTRRPLVRPDFA